MDGSPVHAFNCRMRCGDLPLVGRVESLSPGDSMTSCPPYILYLIGVWVDPSPCPRQGATEGARFKHRNVNVDRVRVTPGSLYSFCRRNFS